VWALISFSSMQVGCLFEEALIRGWALNRINTVVQSAKLLGLTISTRIGGVFSLTWPAYMQIYCNKRKRLHKKRVQLPVDWFGTQHGRRFIVLGH